MTAGIEKYLTYLKAKDYSPGTLAWQRSHLERFSSYVAKKKLGIEKVTEDQIRSYLADLKRSGLATRTRQAHLSALKGLFSYLVKEGIITKNPAARVKPPQGTSSLPAVLTVEEMMRLITTPDLSTPVGVRDRAILGACVKINQNSKRNFNRMQNYISMEKKFKEYQPNQLMLLPPCISDWLPEDHPVHYISEVVEDLDLSAIYQNYRGRRGQPPYEPKMMVKIFIYGVVKGIFSSRKIEKALYEDVGFRILSANQQPDHWTISEFRRRHHKALGELLVQTIQMSDKAGLVKLEHISVDGTKIKANASKHSAMSYGYMKKEEKRLKEEIESILERMEEIDVEEDKKYGNRRGDELPPELATRQKRLAAIKKAKKELEEEAKEKLRKKQAERQEKAKKEGKKYKPRKNIEQALPKDKDQRNFTDPESRIMLNSEKAFIQGYNAQATVDAESQIIVAADLTNEANDKRQLVPQIEQVIQNTGRTPKEMSADTGYYSNDNLEYLRKRKIEGFIPPEKVTHNQWRTQNAIRGRIPKNASKDYLMRRKLRTKRGRERYKLRQTSIEPTYGYIKEELGLRQFLLRGQDKVRSIWRFTCAVHNILKLYRAEMRFAKAV